MTSCDTLLLLASEILQHTHSRPFRQKKSQQQQIDPFELLYLYDYVEHFYSAFILVNNLCVS